MFEITLLAMGKLKEKFYISASEEYTKRLGAYCKFNLRQFLSKALTAKLLALRGEDA